ncbi:vacuolar protein sorting-associated protein 33A, putative [Entamoeba invadens IP1]|uniref:Vacuolar protein sorting-associated protein 33A, putative n=1 Tax=Entamoeba invadens IP1 TaxID=370355 RepID=A0A0A1UBZ3_ENTIV|nr:vacuolar protein sorting-associated protein 33A, putative [Entamoeba invadens IP1]ELP92736.1 vacuolar protein sorting-associated protein 33A, putative [Entamoeba invadens IP1]|eukprot:XP_004259507.1 vacuolar protein sorting-associated protein 33A, putative [Entamoeba invadens IP1]
MKNTIVTTTNTHFQSIFLNVMQLTTRPQIADVLKSYQDFTTETLLKTLPLSQNREKLIICDRHSFSMMELVAGQFLQDQNYKIIDMICYDDFKDTKAFVEKLFRDRFAFIVVTESTTNAAIRAIDFVEKATAMFNELTKKNFTITPDNFFFFRLPRFTPFDGKLLEPYKNKFRIGKIDVPVGVLQSTLFSMQQDDAFVRLFAERDISVVSEVFNALENFQKKFGYIQKIQSRGCYSHQLAEMMNNKRNYDEFNKEIDFMYVVDRSFDLLTPELIASNYESLIDDTFGINDDCTTVPVDLKYFEKTCNGPKESDPLYQVLAQRGSGIIPLHGNWYNDARDLFFLDVPKVLSEKVQLTKELKEKSLQEENILKKIEKTTHFNMCMTFVTLHPQLYQTINKSTNGFDFIEKMDKQFTFFDNTFSTTKQITAGMFKQDIAGPVIELLLLGKHDEALRQLSMISAGCDGIKPETFEEIKTAFIQFNGGKEVDLWSKLEMSGMLKKVGERNRTYSAINSALRIYEKDGKTLYSGYTPLIAKTLENIVQPEVVEEAQKSLLKSMTKIVSKTLPEILPEDEQIKVTDVKGKIEGNPKSILVFVIGGITLGEIATLRNLSNVIKRPIIIGSTNIIRKNSTLLGQIQKSLDFERFNFN